jgi:hypothetical protein
MKTPMFLLVGSESGPASACLKYWAIVDGHQLAKEVATTKEGRKVSFYWEELEPIYATMQEALDNPPKGTGPHPEFRTKETPDE